MKADFKGIFRKFQGHFRLISQITLSKDLLFWNNGCFAQTSGQANEDSAIHNTNQVPFLLL
jgi:hypothetical protein